LSGDIVHVKKSGRFDGDVVLKFLFMIVGELSDDICNRLNPEIAMKVTILNVPWCSDSTLYHFVLVALNHFDTRITSPAPKLDTITPN
jgi:hypothetical protein